MSATDRGVIVLVQSDFLRSHEFAQQVREHFNNKYDVVSASGSADAERALGALREANRRIVAVVADEDLPDGSGSELLRRNASTLPVQGRLVRSGRGESRNDDGVRIIPASAIEDDLWADLESMAFRSATAQEHQVTLRVKARSEAVDRIRRFLLLNWVAVDVVVQTQEHAIVAEVDGPTNPLIDPTLVRLATRLKLLPVKTASAYDLVVVGGGPAGLSAAVNASSLFLDRVLIIENSAPGGTAGTAINEIDNYLGFPQGITADKLCQLATQQANRLKVEWLPAYGVTKLLKESASVTPRYTITAANDDDSADVVTVTAPLVLIATGVAARALGLPTEKIYAGQGIYYLALPADGRQAKENDRIAIIGGGDTAGRAALMFADRKAAVTMVIRHKLRDDMLPQVATLIEAQTKYIKVLENTDVTEFTGTGSGSEARLTGLITKQHGSIQVDSAYVLIGADPYTQWVEEAGIKVVRKNSHDKYGYVATDIDLETKNALPQATNLPGIFAAGDVRLRGVRRIAVAIGDGASAALSMHRYLKKNSAVLSAFAEEGGAAAAYYNVD